MQTNVVIADDFYNDVDSVREFALSQDFSVTGNFPNARTESFSNDSIKETIQRLVYPHGGDISYWPDGYNGAFQYTTQHDRSWIHADSGTTWAALIYLTPNAPLTSGTGLFKHKQTGLTEAPDDEALLSKIYEDSQDYTKWEMTDRMANVYNRIVMYRGNQFHQSLDYFGTNKENGRLFQTFFFSTEW